MPQNKHMINQALLVQRPFSSKALTVLTTLIHRFSERGEYDLFIQRNGQLIHRTQVQVATKNAPLQVDIDMAELTAKNSNKRNTRRYIVKRNGVLSFFVSKGLGLYTVMLIRIGKKHKETVLDSSRQLPEGDFFAVTPVQPGIYQVSCTETNARAELRVLMPKPGDGYRPDRPTLLSLGERGFEMDHIQTFTGQTAVFQCQVRANITVKMIDSDKKYYTPAKHKTFTNI